MRYFIELAYDGTRFHGWQLQPNAISVQEELNGALAKALRNTDINVVGCGRTDTGVHSEYYVAHFDVENPVDESLEWLTFKLNSILPSDICVMSVQQVDDSLHARFSATMRTYHYYVASRKNPFTRFKSYHPPFQLDFDKMNEAASLLLSEEDFTSFARLHSNAKTNICYLQQAEWLVDSNGEYYFRISANRFLRNMVRAIVGTLFDVGRGKLDMDGFKAIIAEKDRQAASSSAAPQGLSLVDVVYPEGRGFARSIPPIL
ncbi:MAG: tRNA pseudouridine(38-40) synthase TruA [Marinilabiliaceae bacterium]|nr:tRNA pseudouridine(38-40) synthase TruA [Marinilabiliaceae bacterium]